MAALQVKKRSWGRTKQREEITIIDREKIEETLQKIAEDSKKSESILDKSSSSSKSTGVDLQYPELMSNDALVAALKRIKVPIPVYPDGTPSRERLMYLYKNNVLPRPQRSRWRNGKRKRHTIPREDRSEAMEVDQQDASSWEETIDAPPPPQQQKRKLSESDNTEGISPAKKISLTPTAITFNHLKLSSNSSGGGGGSTPRRVIKVKRAAVSTSSTARASQGTNQTGNTATSSSSLSPSSSSATTNRVKITWP